MISIAFNTRFISLPLLKCLFTLARNKSNSHVLHGQQRPFKIYSM